ncbi:MarR family winged helix-turn-helix transcriptional regulator [Gemella sp. zg-1178]|uniref:MarR family winged helix-turn-helix transcriptional regulator n=1 Tax=Gemella sp. zg-1178 TaxID=2840372 RepID=UPI001C04DFF0|nr:MarR family winged helix-turn-helix transcriptional regulator [Gemella sp. zg-1178]MBU0278209.1 MarR family winged helix-turn-helix transcriptional regulator [Gemella sp. zg-1178]
MENNLSNIKKLLNDLEKYCTKKAKLYDVENLAGPQGKVLYYLYKNKDKKIFVKDIEKKFDMTKSVTSNLLKRMEKNNFIEIIPSKKDKRYKQVVLTSYAENKIPNLLLFTADVHSVLGKDISKDDWLITKKVLKQLAENILKEENSDV